MDGGPARDRGIPRGERPPRRGGPDGSLSDRLAALGWGGVPFETAFPNLVFLYLSARLDATVALRGIGDREVRDGNEAQADCERAAPAMIVEAERMGRLALLRRPCVREPGEMLALLVQLYGG